jgi:hypothetical protein
MPQRRSAAAIVIRSTLLTLTGRMRNISADIPSVQFTREEA